MLIASELFSVWQPWQVALADTVAAEMIRHNITAEQLREMVREYMSARVASAAERAAAVPGAAPYRHPHFDQRPARRLPRPAWQKEEERGLFYGGQCPKCGATIEFKRMCPHISPRIRTQMACTNDACDWAAVSEHGWDYLARHGMDGNVEVQS